jgi:hypothetical protein
MSQNYEKITDEQASDQQVGRHVPVWLNGKLLRRLSDGHLHPVLRTTRCRKTGRIEDVVQRQRSVEATVVGANGSKERRLLSVGVCHAVPRPASKEPRKVEPVRVEIDANGRVKELIEANEAQS